MVQEEKSQQSKEKILRAAIDEFGKKGYAGASLNTLLSSNGISKGVVYHHFKNKDQLYLECVSACFKWLMAFLSEIECKGTAAEILHDYFETRGIFFRNHPILERVFYDAILQPPPNLVQEITKIRADFDAFNRNLFTAILGGLNLRDGVSEEEGLYYFNLMQNALHLQFRSETGSYEERAFKAMEILLYGIAGGEKQ